MRAAIRSISMCSRSAMNGSAINSDTKGLEELIALEEKGWGREKIIGSARRSLEMIQSKAADGKG